MKVCLGHKYLNRFLVFVVWSKVVNDRKSKRNSDWWSCICDEKRIARWKVKGRVKYGIQAKPWKLRTPLDHSSFMPLSIGVSAFHSRLLFEICFYTMISLFILIVECIVVTRDRLLVLVGGIESRGLGESSWRGLIDESTLADKVEKRGIKVSFEK